MTDLFPKIKALEVMTPEGHSGTLSQESQYVFNYARATPEQEISLTMPRRSQSYAGNQPLPIFAMNLPEGDLHTAIVTRYGKAFAKLNEMGLLAIVGHDQIGRLSLQSGSLSAPTRAPSLGLREILNAKASDGLFEHLLDTYLASGISGVQPKVMVPDGDRAQPEDDASSLRYMTRTSDLIIKSSSPLHPSITENEFACMSAGRIAGLELPAFYLSNDSSLFIIERFDKKADGTRIGFEDMAVLAGKEYHPNGNYKYEGKYEGIIDIINNYCGPNSLESSKRFFEYFTLSCLVRNGDAHLKNFALTYTNPAEARSIRLSPLYDVVTTRTYTYEDRRKDRELVNTEMALRLNKSKQFPTRKELLDFGARCNEIHPAQVIERISDAMGQALKETKDRFRDPDFYHRLSDIWEEGRSWYEPDRVYIRRPETPAPQAATGSTADYQALLSQLQRIAKQVVHDTGLEKEFIDLVGMEPQLFIALATSGQDKMILDSIKRRFASNEPEQLAAFFAKAAPQEPEVAEEEDNTPSP